MKENFYTNAPGNQTEDTIERITREIKDLYGGRIIIKIKAITVQSRNKKAVFALDMIENRYKAVSNVGRYRDKTLLLIQEK